MYFKEYSFVKRIRMICSENNAFKEVLWSKHYPSEILVPKNVKDAILAIYYHPVKKNQNMLAFKYEYFSIC